MDTFIFFPGTLMLIEILYYWRKGPWAREHFHFRKKKLGNNVKKKTCFFPTFWKTQSAKNDHEGSVSPAVFILSGGCIFVKICQEWRWIDAVRGLGSMWKAF